MPIWGFIFILIAAIVFLIEFVQTRRLTFLALGLLSVGLILTYATSTPTVHF